MQHDEPVDTPPLSAAHRREDKAAAALARWEGRPARILHVFSLEKFVAPAIDFMESHRADFDGHLFFCLGDATRYPVRERANVIQSARSTELRTFVQLARAMNRADKIILHGLFDHGVIALLALQPWLPARCYWIIWGGDLYARKLAPATWKWRVAEFFRGIVIRRLGHLVSYLEGDVELARQWYGARGRYRECLAYPSNLYQDLPAATARAGTLNIQIGNSADPSNEHLELLQLLAPFADADIRVFAPLSYGDAAHAQTVARRGRELFGAKFVPMLDFMPLREYLDWLASIDVALFNHRRQQGMGNAITLLGMGKKVHLRTDVSQWAMFRRLGLAVFPVTEFAPARLPAGDAARNREIIQSEFSEAKLKAQLARIFEE